jgi:hypothetical protein
MDNTLSWSKETNLRFYNEKTMLHAHEFLSSDSWMTPTPLARQAKTNCRHTSVPQDCDRTFSVILHCDGHYTGSVTTDISSHFLPQTFFLLSVCHSIVISPIFQTFSVCPSFLNIDVPNKSKTSTTWYNIQPHFFKIAWYLYWQTYFIQRDPVQECPNRCP